MTGERSDPNATDATDATNLASAANAREESTPGTQDDSSAAPHPSAAPPPTDVPDADERALQQVRQKVRRMAHARARQPQLWRHVAQVGTLGWLFILPVVGMSALGHFMQVRLGQRIYGVAGVLAGLAIGGYVVFIHVQRSLREDHDDHAQEHKPRDTER